MICKIIKQATFCKPSDIPEVLVDSMWETNNDLMMNSDSNIPFYYVNEICLSNLNKVIWKAQQIEKESINSVIDAESRLKAKED